MKHLKLCDRAHIMGECNENIDPQLIEDDEKRTRQKAIEQLHHSGPYYPTYGKAATKDY